MLGWLAKKGQNSRVYMCIKEVKWELEAGSPLKRATILALAQIFRSKMFSELGDSQDVLECPLDYSRADLMQFYEMLENIRNQNTMQIDATQKNMKRFGMELPDFAVDHAKACNKDLEIWMCTLGSGIVPDKRDDVREIWKLLTSSRSHLEHAIDHLSKVEEKTREMTGASSFGMFEGVDTAEWIKSCNYIPGSFKKEFKLD